MNAFVNVLVPEHAIIRKMVVRHMIKQQTAENWIDTVGGCDDEMIVPRAGTATDVTAPDTTRQGMRDTSAGSILETAP